MGEMGIINRKEMNIQNSTKSSKDEVEFKPGVVWVNAISLFFHHIFATYGLYLSLTTAKMYTNLFAFALYAFTFMAIAIGAHRLWSHRSFKAAVPLQILLVVLDTIGFQGSVLHWARDHRLHHKYSETNADPHNANRGFFYAQIGWLMLKKHPDVVAKGKGINIDDLRSNPILTFQHKYFKPLGVLGAFIMPTLVPVYFWNETWTTAFMVAGPFRWIYTLHVVGFVNSIAHIKGPRPYDGTMNASDHLPLAVLTWGEGYHNFHHAFPWDYRTGEIGQYNVSSKIIEFFTSIGWAYDLKSVSIDVLKHRVKRTGDGSHDIWGRDDESQPVKERDGAILDYSNAREY